MKIATWNLNYRVGRVRFRPEAADAAVALGADVLVLTEFFPQEHEKRFRNTLRNAGLSEQVMSPQPAEVVEGPLVFKREVNLYVHSTARIGQVTGATAVRYDGPTAPKD